MSFFTNDDGSGMKENDNGTSQNNLISNENPARSILQDYPEYATTSSLDDLRTSEYSSLDQPPQQQQQQRRQQIYLDYTGASLPSASQLAAHHARLRSTTYGNPHSINPTSEASNNLIDDARARILAHFNAPGEEYAVIFTANATAAAKLVGEAYPFGRRTKLLLTSDNHNCVNGLRRFAERSGVKTRYVPLRTPDLRIDERDVEAALKRRCCLFESVRRGGGSSSAKRGLFAYPAQSNFSGVRHPLSWVTKAQQHGYDVLLDAAAYLPTATIDLSVVKPEFMIVSWYKVFGFPTGVGCLIARRSALSRLKRPWFSGGTVIAVGVALQRHAMVEDETAFEDGTVNFMSIPDVIFGLDWIQKIGVRKIATRVDCLTAWFLERLLRLKHWNGRPMVVVYGPTDRGNRGGTVAFNFLDVNGHLLDVQLVAEESAAARISLRVGCFCNPGAAEAAFGRTKIKLLPVWRSKVTSVEGYAESVGLSAAGALRVSFGIPSNVADVNQFFAFAVETYMDREVIKDGRSSRSYC